MFQTQYRKLKKNELDALRGQRGGYRERLKDHIHYIIEANTKEMAKSQQS